ncbi:MAG: MBL fold metallo-hydrolase, partial [Chloroflexi bacterium]|nr:MBL fold metallo-hydrolase [Chloroflexota bacterium]
MTIDIRKLTLGPVQTNCYILGDTDTRDAVVIDPVDQADAILQVVREAGWTVREILATHAHFDHIMASADLKAATGAPFRYHERDAPLANALPERAKQWLGLSVAPAPPADSFVQ